MAIVQNLYTGNGTTVLFPFSFDYLDQTHVKVTLNGVASTAFVFANDTTIQFLTAPLAGVAIRIYRETDNDQTEATFFSGSAIKAADLNSNFTQTLYVVQEVFARTFSTFGGTLAGILNMGGFRITNLGTPSSSTDASTKAYVDLNVGAVSASAVSAATSAMAASNSATSAASSAASALAAFDSFDDRYLGSKASDPTVDNDGDPLTSGDLYWNTTLSVMKVYTGSVWVIAYVPGDATNISFTPYGTVASSNVQGAVQELVDEKLNLTGGTLSGNLVLNNQNDLRFGEATANGTNYVAFQAPASVVADVVWTLPATDAVVSGHALKSNAAGTLSWGTAGGAAGGGTDDVFYENAQTVTTSYTISTNKNAMSTGPITINAGVTITVPTGQSWVII